jgi:lysozyme family protein
LLARHRQARRASNVFFIERHPNMSKTAFDTQIPKTLAFEGGYVFDRNDPGGETRYGISKRSYPDLDIATLTQQQAIDIYYTDYWLKPGIDMLPDSFSGKVFDAGVNMGPRTAIRILQRVLAQVANPSLVKSVQPFDYDGVIGFRTVALASDHNLAPSAVLKYYIADLVAYYQGLADQHPVMQKYLTGWLRRANAV